MLYYCALYTSAPEDYTWTVYIYITKDSATYRHRIKEDTKYLERKSKTYTVATVNHKHQNSKKANRQMSWTSSAS